MDQKFIEAKAKEQYPRKGYTRDAFIKGAQWASVAHWHVAADRPIEGKIVFCAYRVDRRKSDGELFAEMNMAKYQNGVFHSYTEQEPVLWCYPPLFPTEGYPIGEID